VIQEVIRVWLWIRFGVRVVVEKDTDRQCEGVLRDSRQVVRSDSWHVSYSVRACYE
jgi:hypothetical protein